MKKSFNLSPWTVMPKYSNFEAILLLIPLVKTNTVWKYKVFECKVQGISIIITIKGGYKITNR